MSIKKETFEKFNGFNEFLTSNEEYDLVYKLINNGYNFYSVPLMILQSYVPEKFLAIFRREKKYALDAPCIVKKYFKKRLILYFSDITERTFSIKFPFTICLRLNFFKIIIISLLFLQKYPFIFLTLFFILLIYNCIKTKFNIKSCFSLLTYYISSESGRLLGHLIGSIRNKMIYI